MEIRSSHKRIIYLLFGTSGFCALVYEILWTKYLSLTFGTTMIAVSVVAATFMGGLALGSYLLGRYADQEANLLRIYAFLELGIALTALLFPPTLAVVEKAYVLLSRALPSNPAVSTSFYFGFSALLLLPPAGFMGGTFPLMCRFFARKKCGGQIARLYALNTLGATFGAFAAGFFLIPRLGLSTTGYLIIALNLIIAGASFLFARKIGSTSIKDVSKATRPEQPLKASRHRLVLVTIALIGFFSLAYEILWTRVLLLFLGNTTYAFSLMLSAYLVGISLGGAIYARKVKPEINEKKVFIQLTVLMGLSIMVTAPFYDRLAFLFQFAHEASGERWWHLSLLSFCIVFAVMCIPTIISGSLLPAAVAILDPGKTRTGAGVGLVVLNNTFGAVLGSLVAGFFLTPVFGLLGSFRLLATLNILLAMILYLRYWKEKELGRKSVPALGMIGVLLAVIPTSWDQNLMNSGVYYYAPMIAERGGIDKAMEDYRIIDVVEGTDTTVAVKETRGGQVRFFTVNGKTDGGTGRDTATQLLIGQIPILLHPDPREVMVIGLGTGITLGGIKEHPVRKIECVEISPGVAAISRYFSEENRHVLQDPRVNLAIRDGRNSLLIQNKKYDVIVSEPSNPWQSGNANLFTAEFYELAASRLRENGILCQWLPLYDLNTESLQVASRTFLQTFPNVLVFKVDSDMVMVGSQSPVKVNYQQMQERMNRRGAREILAQTGVSSPADLIAHHFLFSAASLHNFSGKAQTNSDDHPILEFSYQSNLGPGAFSNNLQANLAAIKTSSLGEPLPLFNLGTTSNEVACTFRELSTSCSKAGRVQEARYFMEKAAKLEML